MVDMSKTVNTIFVIFATLVSICVASIIVLVAIFRNYNIPATELSAVQVQNGNSISQGGDPQSLADRSISLARASSNDYDLADLYYTKAIMTYPDNTEAVSEYVDFSLKHISSEDDEEVVQDYLERLSSIVQGVIVAASPEKVADLRNSVDKIRSFYNSYISSRQSDTSADMNSDTATSTLRGYESSVDGIDPDNISMLDVNVQTLSQIVDSLNEDSSNDSAVSAILKKATEKLQRVMNNTIFEKSLSDVAQLLSDAANEKDVQYANMMLSSVMGTISNLVNSKNHVAPDLQRRLKEVVDKANQEGEKIREAESQRILKQISSREPKSDSQITSLRYTDQMKYWTKLSLFAQLTAPMIPSKRGEEVLKGKLTEYQARYDAAAGMRVKAYNSWALDIMKSSWTTVRDAKNQASFTANAGDIAKEFLFGGLYDLYNVFKGRKGGVSPTVGVIAGKFKLSETATSILTGRFAMIDVAYLTPDVYPIYEETYQRIARETDVDEAGFRELSRQIERASKRRIEEL